MSKHILDQLEKGELNNTKHLKLNCGLTEFPEAVFSLQNTLEILDLSGNHLSTLPNDFYKLSELRILFLGENNFTVFPEVLAKCKKLSMIGFKSNQLHTISENSIPVQTRWLILTNNQLTSLPKSIGNCYNMQKLALAGNQLTQLPIELSNCKNLGLLRISANKLTEFSTWLLTMPKLSWLAFAGNPFCHQPNIEAILEEINWNNLTLAEQLGQGASGIISKAFWKKENNTIEAVAVKEFKGAVTSDGLPEDEMNACILAGFHKNLIPLLGKVIDHNKNKEALVLGLIPPSFFNLGLPPTFETCTRDVFEDHTIFSAQQIYSIATAIASVVKHLHENGILHGDLYAHNILVNSEVDALLGDFGAATIYNKQDTLLAEGLEKIEVCAFGCLIEDLLTCLSSEEKNKTLVSALNNLKMLAMQPNVYARPNFNELYTQLKLIHN